ncbi:MAG: DNA polymerase III subunit alpha [Candidatus Marinimicrobia bacterium]|nr:DNA polymerase III subunit alpha [Candidatus Neomarinimicrobiota bacterium]MCF7903551.1 DNA polymerase III subunit alpha [Candidatus Neomarinimicrobiota bacterium]
MAEFVHLHNHSHYSLLDGAARVDQIIAKLSELDQKSFALTDHGNMFGAVEFFKKAKAANIKPIIGMEAYVSPGAHTEKRTYNEGKRAYHLVMLAKNETGYRNLLKLTSLAYLDGFYFNPRVDKDLLRKHSEGIVATSACLSGQVNYHAARGDYDRAREQAIEYDEIFGRGNFYLELQRHFTLNGSELEMEAVSREVMKKVSKDTGIPLVATNDAHYVSAAHHEAHDALICIGRGKFISDTQRMKYDTKDIYIKSAEDMVELFKDVPEAIENTLKIDEMCQFNLETGVNHMPEFPIPEGLSLNDHLDNVTREGLDRRVKNVDSQYTERLEYELDVIKKMGFPGYFLITHDFVQYAKQNRIPVGPGRGSAAGSLVAYSLGITDLDPLQYNLLFERFLNPDRISMPDIDIDFCYDRREEVIDYMRHRFGEDSVTQIITFNKLKARAVIRDVGRVLEIPIKETDRIAKLVPEELGIKLPQALKKSPELKQASEQDVVHEKLFNFSQVLEGMNRNAGKHAAGLVIAPGKLTDYIPLYKSPKDGTVTSQYDMKAIEDVGLIKFDFLGLRTLTVIQEAIDLIHEFRGETIDINTIPMDDKAVYKLFADGLTIGLFQFESTGMREYLKKLKPTALGDLIAMNALYRPGPMGNINDFIDRKHGKQKVTYLHPLMEDILKETYGIIVYQEQVMQLGSVISGFSLSKADLMRRAMGKKIKALMDEMKGEFISGAKKNNINEKLSSQIWDLIEKFAQYGFNKSHSAAYSVIAYQTAYLKTHYPVEFMAANLSSEKDNTDKIQMLLAECRKLGITVKPPDVNSSNVRFSPGENKSILYGLNTIKKVGSKAAEAIMEERRANGPFESIFDFCSRVDSHNLNKGVIEALVGSGAMDTLPGARWEKFMSVEDAVHHGQRVQTLKNTNQTDLFGGGDGIMIKEPELSEAPSWNNMDMLNRERDYVGFYLTGHPLEGYESEIQSFSNINLLDLAAVRDEQDVRVGGIISAMKIHYDKRNNQMAFFTLNGLDGSIDALTFSDPYSKFKEYVTNDSLVFVEGKISKRSDDDVKVLVNKVLPIQEAQSDYAREVHIAFDPAVINSSDLETAKDLARRYSGACDLVFHLKEKGNGDRLMVARNIRVSANRTFILTLRETFGEDNVWVK